MKTIADDKSKNVKLASFWARLIAHLIDRIIFTIPLSLLLFIYTDIVIDSEMGRGLSLGVSIVVLIIWLYHALFEGGKSGATLGKKIMKIKVTNLEFDRINFSIATLRLFAKFLLSDLLLLGYLMIFFSKNKQGLHDIVAGTKVIKN